MNVSRAGPRSASPSFIRWPAVRRRCRLSFKGAAHEHDSVQPERSGCPLARTGHIERHRFRIDAARPIQSACVSECWSCIFSTTSTWTIWSQPRIRPPRCGHSCRSAGAIASWRARCPARCRSPNSCIPTAQVLQVTIAPVGDYSRYTLTIQQDRLRPDFFADSSFASGQAASAAIASPPVHLSAGGVRTRHRLSGQGLRLVPPHHHLGHDAACSVLAADFGSGPWMSCSSICSALPPMN